MTITDTLEKFYLTENLAFEGFFTVLYASIVKYCKNVIDVGAAAGYYTFIAMHHMKEGNIYCYEPDPDRFQYLKEAINRYSTNIKIIARETAVGDKKEQLPFRCSTDQKKSGLLESTPHYIHPVEGHDKTIIVSLDTLDNMHPDEHIDLIKMDTEGNEINVLNGAEKLIERCKPDLFIEYHGHTSVGISSAIKKYGYRGIDFGNGRSFFTFYKQVFK